MPVEKFRSIEEMNAAPILDGHPEGRRNRTQAEDAFNRFVRHCARYWTISPRVYPRGVFRFRSVEEAQAARPRPATANR